MRLSLFPWLPIVGASEGGGVGLLMRRVECVSQLKLAWRWSLSSGHRWSDTGLPTRFTLAFRAFAFPPGFNLNRRPTRWKPSIGTFDANTVHPRDYTHDLSRVESSRVDGTFSTDAFVIECPVALCCPSLSTRLQTLFKQLPVVCKAFW